MKFRYLGLLLLPALAGCDSLGALGLANTDTVSADDASCRAYGFSPAGEGYANCRLQLDLEHRQDSRSQGQELRTGLLSMSQGAQSRNQATLPPRVCMVGGFRTAC